MVYEDEARLGSRKGRWICDSQTCSNASSACPPVQPIAGGTRSNLPSALRPTWHRRPSRSRSRLNIPSRHQHLFSRYAPMFYAIEKAHIGFSHAPRDHSPVFRASRPSRWHALLAVRIPPSNVSGISFCAPVPVGRAGPSVR